jgi:hypothetical protein
MRYQDLLLKDLVSTSTVVCEYVHTQKHQETEICFLETEIHFLVTPKQNFVSETLQNAIPFPLETKFRFRITLLYKPQQLAALAVRGKCHSLGSVSSCQPESIGWQSGW